MIFGKLRVSHSKTAGTAVGGGRLRRSRVTPEDICLACGMCCDGTIFADVTLQPGDAPDELLAIGLPLRASRRQGTSGACGSRERMVRVQRFRFLQPCVCFEGCRCTIYAERPQYCRHFECGVLKALKAGIINRVAAMRRIRSTRAKADEVLRLLRKFGDTEEELPLAKRFRRTSRRLEQVGLKLPRAHLYGKLTLAAHNLNFLLSKAFYPGSDLRGASPCREMGLAIQKAEWRRSKEV